MNPSWHCIRKWSAVFSPNMVERSIFAKHFAGVPGVTFEDTGKTVTNNRATEYDISVAATRIAAAQANGVASFRRLRRDIPNYVNLTSDDWVQSETRPNEAMWMQLVRNIKSHFASPGNFIHDGYLEHVSRVGYRVTPAGLALLNRLGF